MARATAETEPTDSFSISCCIFDQSNSQPGFGTLGVVRRRNPIKRGPTICTSCMCGLCRGVGVERHARHKFKGVEVAAVGAGQQAWLLRLRAKGGDGPPGATSLQQTHSAQRLGGPLTQLATVHSGMGKGASGRRRHRTGSRRTGDCCCVQLTLTGGSPLSERAVRVNCTAPCILILAAERRVSTLLSSFLAT